MDNSNFIGPPLPYGWSPVGKEKKGREQERLKIPEVEKKRQVEYKRLHLLGTIIFCMFI